MSRIIRYGGIAYNDIGERTVLGRGHDYTVFAIEKDSRDDVGQPKRGAIDVTYDEAAAYAERNESPDNSERYVVRVRVEPRFGYMGDDEDDL